MSNTPKNNYQTKTRNLPMPVEAKQIYEVSEQSWRVLTEVTFPTAKTPEAIMMALDYCRTRKLDIFKKPVHVVPMWSATLGRSVETVWPSIMEFRLPHHEPVSGLAWTDRFGVPIKPIPLAVGIKMITSNGRIPVLPHIPGMGGSDRLSFGKWPALCLYRRSLLDGSLQYRWW